MKEEESKSFIKEIPESSSDNEYKEKDFEKNSE